MSSTYPPFGGASAQTCLRCGRQLPLNGSYCENCGYDNPSPQRGNSAGRIPSTTSTLSWDGGRPAMPSHQEQGRGQAGVQWGQLPVPPLQNGFSGQQSMPPNSPASMPSSPPMSPLPNRFAEQRPFTTVPNNFGDLPPLRPPDDQFPPLPPRQDGFQGFSPLSQGQNSFAGQSAFPQPLGANDFSGASSQSMGGIQPLNGSGRLLSTGNVYGPGPTVSPQVFNPAAMPANLRTGMAYEPQAMPLPEKKRRGSGAGVIVGIGLLIIVLIGGGIAGYVLLGPGKTPQTANTPAPTTKDTPIFTDAFTNNNNGWNLQGDPGKFSASVGNGAMVLEDDNHSLLWEVVPGQKTFSNFKLVVDTVLSKGDQNNGYGVFIRGASNQNSQLATYYRFALYGDGSYAIFKGSVDANGNTTNTRLQDYAQDPAIKKGGGLNHMIIVANGPAMTLIVNGQPLKTVTDNSYTSGSVALFVINLNPSQTGGQATFSNFGIYQLKP